MCTALLGGGTLLRRLNSFAECHPYMPCTQHKHSRSLRKKNKKKYKNKTSAIVFSKTATSLLCRDGTEMRTGAYNYFSSTKTQKNQPEKNL